MEQKFALGNKVKMAMTEESGLVVGCATYSDLDPQILVRYKNANGEQVEKWWACSAVVSAE